MQLQEVYLKTLKAALASHGGMPMAPVEAALAAHAAGSTAPVDSAPEVAKQEEEEPPANGVSAADGRCLQACCTSSACFGDPQERHTRASD